MGRNTLLAVGAALLLLGLALYASRPGPGVSGPAAAPPAAVPSPGAALPAGDEPASEAAAASPAAAPQHGTEPAAAQHGAEPAAAQSEAAAHVGVEPGGAVEAEPAAVPLEKLLTWDEPRPAPRGVDLSADAGSDAPAGPGGSGVRDRVYLERRSDDLGPSDRDRKVDTTDVGVRVPVASSVEVRGGVRVEQRQDGETEKDQSTPTVGVGVRF